MSMSYDAPRHLTLAGALSSEESLSNEQDYTWTGSAEKRWALAEGDEVSVRGSSGRRAAASSSRAWWEPDTGSIPFRSITLLSLI